MPSPGISFVPGQQDPNQQQQGAMGAAPSGMPPVQQAIQMLSMRLPRVLGANAMAPGALLSGQGSAGMPPGLLQQLYQLIAGMPSQNAGVAPQHAPSIPTPGWKFEDPQAAPPQTPPYWPGPSSMPQPAGPMGPGDGRMPGGAPPTMDRSQPPMGGGGMMPSNPWSVRRPGY